MLLVCTDQLKASLLPSPKQRLEEVYAMLPRVAADMYKNLMSEVGPQRWVACRCAERFKCPWGAACEELAGGVAVVTLLV